jgi:hypothetical protein
MKMCGHNILSVVVACPSSREELGLTLAAVHLIRYKVVNSERPGYNFQRSEACCIKYYFILQYGRSILTPTLIYT